MMFTNAAGAVNDKMVIAVMNREGSSLIVPPYMAGLTVMRARFKKITRALCTLRLDTLQYLLQITDAVLT